MAMAAAHATVPVTIDGPPALDTSCRAPLSTLHCVAYMDPPWIARTISRESVKGYDCTHISGLLDEGHTRLLALMDSALFLLNTFTTCWRSVR
jgi:hypothetical protein